MSKLIIPNTDPDDQEETKEVTPVELDLDFGEQGLETAPPPFSEALALAAADGGTALAAEEEKEKKRRGLARFAEGQKALAEQFRRETGLEAGYEKPWAFRPKPKAAYTLWERIIPVLIERPDMLDLSVAKLAGWFDVREPEFSVTRNMLNKPLNFYARRDLGRKLNTLGVTLPLKSPVSISSVRRELIERRNAAASPDVEEFTARVKIQGETATINGASYTVQRNRSGQRRIKRDGRWLNLDALKDFCSG